MRLSPNLSALLLVGSAAIASVAHGQTLGVTISNDGGRFDNFPWNLGYSFTVLSASSVTSLGVWDDGGDGLLKSHQVGLWSSAGVLLASATVGAGTSGILDGSFRFTDITPFALTLGATYYVGATFNGPGDDLWTSDPSSVVTAPTISYDSRRFVEGSALAFPGSAGSGGTGYWGGNVRLDVSSPVPEPSTVVLLGAGLVGLLGLRRLQRA